MPSPRNILLVGIEGELRRGLRAHEDESRDEWHFIHARGFLEAMALLGARPCEAVVAALALPGFSGGQLMMEVMHRHPRARRILVAEPRRLPASPKCSGAAHQIWLLPFGARSMLERLTAALSRETWFASDSTQRLFARLLAMPPLPEVYFQIEEARNHGEIEAGELARILAGFPEVRRHWLRWTAAAGQGGPRVIPWEHLALVLLAHLRAFFGLNLPRPAEVESWEGEALMTARLAREIARGESGDETTVRASFFGGLLHDAGRLLLEINHPERVATARRWSQQKAVPVWQAEHAILGMTHADLGACLLSQWGLPWPVVEAVARSHDPERIGPAEFSASTAVRAAILAAAQWGNGGGPGETAASEGLPGLRPLPAVAARELAAHVQAA